MAAGERSGRSAARRGSPYRPPRRSGNPALWLLVAVAAVLVVVVLAAVARRKAQNSAGPTSGPVPAAVMSALTGVPQATWDSVGDSGAVGPTLVSAGQRPSGAPTVLYIGAEYCPYCAAERWPLTMALARFGQFQGLGVITSSATDYPPSIHTFTFHGATYQSQWVKLQTVETAGNVALASGGYPPLEPLSAAQQSILNKYDAPPFVPANSAGSIPFLFVGGQFLWVGSSISPTLLQGQSWSQLAGALAAGQTAAARAMVSNANAISAAICAVDGGQPASVCTGAGVQAAKALLGGGA